ncbi:MAG TPA: Gfo/Idh/MocA family oxidoreductase [Steroidobacteraceae bacterium]|nr:Gfo/Idh/MocA family oxidoreductase [Steroidobacteraceae bacterium]
MNRGAASPLRFGVLGAANIARGFIAGVKPSGRIVVGAIASRDADKAERFARETGVGRWHGSYEALLADPEIDAIYNPLPNSLHAEWSIRACSAGKHVLCEKPLATSAIEARSMFQAASRNGVRLMEGYPYRAQPQTIRLLELVSAGAIGRLQLIQSSFGFTLAAGPNIRLDSGLAGGALMDAGTYPVSLVRMVAAERPSRVQAHALWADGVDRALAATLEFQSGLIAQISCSFSTGAHRQALIAGTSGVIQSAFQNHPPPERPAEILLKRGTGWDSDYERVQAPALNGFLAEAEAFCDLIDTGRTGGGASSEESIDIAMTLAAILRSARSGRAADVTD